MSAVHEELARVVAALPAEQAQRVLKFALFVRSGKERLVDYSDVWTEVDLHDWAVASFRYFDRLHPDEDWGVDYSQMTSNPPGHPS